MKFYSVMQMNAITCKHLIKTASTKKEKQIYQCAFILKNLLCTLFAIIFVILLNYFFGAANSVAAVAIFCALLTLRFVDFGYKIHSSIFSLFLIFCIMTLAPYFVHQTGIFAALIINIISILSIVILTCHNPLYGNHSIFVFDYLLIQGTPVFGHDFILRIEEMFVGFLICTVIFFIKSRKRTFKRGLKDVIKEFSITSSRSQWQLQLSLGVSLALMLGELLHLPRTMWLGFSSLCVLQPFQTDAKTRFQLRIPFIIIGSILFGILYSISPTHIRSIFGILAGIVVGFCATFQWTTIINCFGGLLTASSIYGLIPAILFRIINNIIGCSFAYFFHIVFQKSIHLILERDSKFTTRVQR